MRALAQVYRDPLAPSPDHAAIAKEIDAVIDPAETRSIILKALETG